MESIQKVSLKVQFGDIVKRLISQEYTSLLNLRFAAENSFKELEGTIYKLSYVNYLYGSNCIKYLLEESDLAALIFEAQAFPDRVIKIFVEKEVTLDALCEDTTEINISEEEKDGLEESKTLLKRRIKDSNDKEPEESLLKLQTTPTDEQNPKRKNSILQLKTSQNHLKTPSTSLDPLITPTPNPLLSHPPTTLSSLNPSAPSPLPNPSLPPNPLLQSLLQLQCDISHYLLQTPSAPRSDLFNFLLQHIQNSSQSQSQIPESPCSQDLPEPQNERESEEEEMVPKIEIVKYEQDLTRECGKIGLLSFNVVNKWTETIEISSAVVVDNDFLIEIEDCQLDVKIEPNGGQAKISIPMKTSSIKGTYFVYLALFSEEIGMIRDNEEFIIICD
ncbi:unnamed protein product [Moneuplotes crassus]|uniref:Uncharacterized protein n=1 Tax=Euplotes crassus TaxID=5936 RepID=A0AAD1X6Q0_EUPCR|nr:unnamed protein product [Moneuplotes crassus]